jgi:stage II sporulation protein D
MKPLALLLWCALASAQPLRIGVFGLFHPVELTVRPDSGGALLTETGSVLVADGDTMRCTPSGASVRCSSPAGTFTSLHVLATPRGETGLILSVPGKIERRFTGALEITAADGALVPVIVMDLEAAVASAVAAESLPGAPLEALKTQAVVSRSYYAAARGRHAHFNFCDTTHCQFLREAPPAEHPAARAARATSGFVIVWRGAPVEALFSARCGGRTRPLPRAENYPFFQVECPCPRAPRVSCSYCRGRESAGHGTGLCQAGAGLMAREGSDFAAILAHYYPNTTLVPLLRY